MKKFIQEFKEFAVRGNVMDLAVAVIIGNAINAIVKSLVDNIFTPVLSIFVGRIEISTLKFTIPSRLTGANSITVGYGAFLQQVLNFLTVTFCIFILIKVLKKVQDFTFLKKQEEENEQKQEKLKTEDLLVEIRDLLREQSVSHAGNIPCGGSTTLDLPDKLDDKH